MSQALALILALATRGDTAPAVYGRSLRDRLHQDEGVRSHLVSFIRLNGQASQPKHPKSERAGASTTSSSPRSGDWR
jgi:hypothetical protein